MLSARVPDLDALELLLAIGRTGSLTRAGAERGISQSAVSMRMQTVERLVGARLVERGPMGSRLTVAGSLLVVWAADVLRAAERLDAGIASLHVGGESRLRIAASLTIAEHLLPGWLQQLRAGRPETAVALTAVNSAVVAELVLTRQAELGFVEGPRVARGLASRLIGADELCLVCAPGAPLSRRTRRPVSPGELAATPLVEREAGSGTRAALDAALAGALGQSVLRPTPLLEVSSTSAVRAAVAAGVGPAVMSGLAVRTDLADGRLVAVAVAGLDLRRRLRAVWLRGSDPLGAARDLMGIATRPLR